MTGNDDLLLADPHTVKGTPAFLPPEVYRKMALNEEDITPPEGGVDLKDNDPKRYHGRAADVWARV